MTRFNAAFWRWFGDSKVVDQDGEPLVVYHGTDAKFSEFSLHGEGVFLAYDEDVASSYGKNVMPVYVRADKILRASSAGDVIQAAEDAGIEGKSLTALRGYAGKPTQELLWELNQIWADFTVLGDLSVEFDAVEFYDDSNTRTGDGSTTHRTLFVFDPTQIKSATASRGTWSRTDPDIRMNPGFRMRRNPWDHYYVDSSGKIIWSTEPHNLYIYNQLVKLKKIDKRMPYVHWAEKNSGRETAAETMALGPDFVRISVENSLSGNKAINVMAKLDTRSPYAMNNLANALIELKLLKAMLVIEDAKTGRDVTYDPARDFVEQL